MICDPDATTADLPEEHGLFAAEDSAPTAVPTEIDGPWLVLIVDDDRDVHAITRIVLDGYSFKGRRIDLLSAHSAAEARAIFATRGDIAVVLIDVVMETDDAGLRLTRDIRDSIG